MSDNTLKVSPPWHWLPLEGRALAEYTLDRLRRKTPELERGDGHRVIVVPGFLGDDRAVAPLVEALNSTGYKCQSWGLGRNMGMTREVGQGLSDLLDQQYAESGATVSLVGWSLGGIFARELARRSPHKVRQVITLGSPIQDGDNLTISVLFRLTNRKAPRKTDPQEQAKRSEPPPVPCSAIFTRSDGIVPWKAALEPDRPHTRSVEVRGSHFGLPVNREVWKECARLLAYPKARPRS